MLTAVNLKPSLPSVPLATQLTCYTQFI